MIRIMVEIKNRAVSSSDCSLLSENRSFDELRMRFSYKFLKNVDCEASS